MKNVTTNFKNNIKKYGRQIDAIITYGDITITKEDINNISPWFKTSLFKTVMNVLEIDTNIEIEKGTHINAKIGVKFGNGNYEYVEFNDYIVNACEKQEDTESYKIIAYDKMIESMIDYDLTVTYPITIRNYLVAIFNRLNWRTDGIPLTFINSTKEIKTDIHSNIGYTFRDVLDELATITGSFIYIKNTVPTLGYITDTEETINEEYLSQDDVTIGERYFVNSLVFSRAEESDNIYKKDDNSIEEYGLHEFRISDNQILSTNDRDDFIDELFDYLSGLDFYMFDVKSTGIMFFEVTDRFNITSHNNTYSVVLLNNEITVDQDIEEHLYSEKPEETETDYKYADSTDRKVNQTYLIVDKQNQIIESVVNNVTEQNNKISKVQQTIDSLNSKIGDIADITISQESNCGILNFERINQSEPIHIEIRPLGQNISCLYPFETLFPSNNLFITMRTLRFTNITTNEIFDYILPDDLLYYNSDNYDSFVMDYDSQTCYVNKKCLYDNETGEVVLLDEEEIIEYPFAHINLTDGDYKVEILKYDDTPWNAYLFVRLMCQNIYTTQFATRAEVNSEINQTAQNIDLSVNEKLSNYSTTTQMNSAISLKSNQILSSVSNTYSTKGALNTAKAEIKQTTDSISNTVSRKVGNDEIISKINQSAEQISINAEKINLNGKKINLTSGDISISSNNFNVDKNGNLTCTNANVQGKIKSNNATITGGSINITGPGNSVDMLNLINSNNTNEKSYYRPGGFGIVGTSERIDVQVKGHNFDVTSIELIGASGGYSNSTAIKTNGIRTPSLTQSSLEEYKKNFEKLEDALNIIKKVDIYKYNLKSQKDGEKKHIGFVIGKDYKYSQDITSQENDGVDTYSMISVAYKAIQEQQAMIEMIQKENKNKDNIIQDLLNRIEKFETEETNGKD